MRLAKFKVDSEDDKAHWASMKHMRCQATWLPARGSLQGFPETSRGEHQPSCCEFLII